MSLKDKFEAIKSAIHNAMNFAEPEEVLRKAEHEFKEGIVAEFEAVHAKLKALEEKVFGTGEAAALPPIMTAAQVASASSPAENAQPAVAENTGSGAAPVDSLGATTDSAAPQLAAAGTASIAMQQAISALENSAFATPPEPKVFDGILPAAPAV
ncbi:hypothetical protein LMG18090_04385 [Ralstonia mannitolilytica]|uniref:hypothetical protein n=1 Tax=Ralstonia mannitolilytica TaxID=105219 RepID=UPI0028F513F1|nr:hypothetical protein [Ralstonia mannitolilytica]CAJ0803070.1 hypothetical protein LMG18090_04385 [Ralstonia mannitolilytica]